MVGSTIARACGRGIYLHAGPEIAVVSTKTFMSTLVAFVLLALHLGRMKDVSAGAGRRLIDALERCRTQLAALIAEEEHRIAALAKKYARIRQRLFRRPQRGLCAGDGRCVEAEGGQLLTR